ncbi:hypothetical protein ABMA46_10260 [Mesorhizobium sp. CN5-321]|uniref:DUF4376 domain-containing protein n=1 Tax=Mesorhizobium hunchu TaxID=3157708 RepID=UPI0032B769C5
MSDTPYDPFAWFWQIGDDDSRYWSSAAGAYIETLPDGAGLTRIASEAELSDVLRPYGLRVPVASNEDVNAERERRIAAGATVTVTAAGAIPVQGRDVDVRNLQGLGLAALARVSAGDTTTMTTFRDADNVDHDLTPPQVLELVQRAAGVVEAIITASWAIKAMDPLPADVTDDALWPST